jgi:hypothetical protein
MKGEIRILAATQGEIFPFLCNGVLLSADLQSLYFDDHRSYDHERRASSCDAHIPATYRSMILCLPICRAIAERAGNRSICLVIGLGWYRLTRVPVNYRIQFNDLVTALPICRSAALLSVKMRSSPVSFSTTLLASLSSFPLLHGRRASGLGELLLLSLTRALLPTDGYDAPVRKLPHRNCPLLFAGLLGSAVSPTVTTGNLHSTMTPTKCLAFQVPGGRFT